ncbi:MAG TPA: SDR family oxidoreductase [Alphaproteobacteria bacterium]|nr:SDR family oxidoreductase [Alphaproteobacteria bacterium]
MQGRICLVTGATDGIGFVTARELARAGATVIVAGRDPAKGLRTLEQIRRDTGNPDVVFEQADLSLMAEVRELAAAVRAAYPRLDVLVNNAGGMFARRQETAEGLEHTFALNHMAYFLLTGLLREPLAAAPAARVVNVASAMHRGAGLDFDDLQLRHGYDGWRAYRRSKLMNVMFTYALARRLEDQPITANSLHPGFVRSRFGHNNRNLGGLGLRLAQRFTAISPEAGARTSLHLATSPELEGVSGRYFVNCAVTDSSPESRDAAAQERLWQESTALCGL